jgi:hypothetical protein
LKVVALSSFLCEKVFFADLHRRHFGLMLWLIEIDRLWLLSVCGFCAMVV